MPQTIHSANLKLEMYTLNGENNLPTATRKDPVGPLLSVAASFPTNDIPTLEMEVPLGRKIADGSLEKSYVYEGTLKGILRERRPVGVYLTVEKTGSGNLVGLKEGTLCLFKGYAMNASEENGINGGSMRIALSHWLCDLAIFPILHRLSSPENSADVSTDSVFQEKTGTDSKQVQESDMSGCSWTAGGAYRKVLETANADLLEAIKAGFNTALQTEANLEPTEGGVINKDLFEKVKNSLDALKSENLAFRNITEDSAMIQWAIADTLAKEQRDAYFSVTLWQKLVQTLLPQFYASIIPTVNQGIVIPQPGIHMNRGQATTIDKNIIMSLRTRVAYGKTLGGVVLAGRPGASLPFGIGSTKITKFRYPEKQNPGVLKACYLPPWLENYKEKTGSHLAPATKDGSVTSPDAATTAESTSEEHSDLYKQQANDYEEFAKAFTRSVYYAEVTKGNAATLTTVLNLDLCPGTVVRIPIPSDVTFTSQEEQHYCYGTIHTVQYTISPETAVSSYVLTNVRTEDQAKTYETTDGLLYSSGWYNNKEHTLYVEET